MKVTKLNRLITSVENLRLHLNITFMLQLTQITIMVLDSLGLIGTHTYVNLGLPSKATIRSFFNLRLLIIVQRYVPILIKIEIALLHQYIIFLQTINIPNVDKIWNYFSQFVVIALTLRD